MKKKCKYMLLFMKMVNMQFGNENHASFNSLYSLFNRLETSFKNLYWNN